ncbi:hypothetical protein DNTS_029020 [Danionella cerebrum]|uniref:Uncharacterized protein n=1 Tax=Danionella cerebrum TaxID=2873325 RepID=A0A553QD41_9TELE|nr:hypothetical protein DNTS_029020 [Danionella translucida]
METRAKPGNSVRSPT